MLNKSISYQQKLAAIEQKYYGNQIWVPKVGDYYTIVRNDLWLFQIVKEENGQFYFTCSAYEGEGYFPVEGFADKDFGKNRVHVPDWIFTHIV